MMSDQEDDTKITAGEDVTRVHSGETRVDSGETRIDSTPPPTSLQSSRSSDPSLSITPDNLLEDRLLSSMPRTELNGRSVPTIGGIPLLSKLGQGGMGAVYLGYKTRLRQLVAVKVLPLHLAQLQPDMVSRFLREAQIAASIESPHLVRVSDVDEEEGLSYFVMEYVTGVSAGAYLTELRRSGQRGLPEAEALDICIAVTTGLAVAHEAGVVHRDVKPDNTLIPRVREGAGLRFRDSKISDLGLARSEELGQTITGSQFGMGTPGYMAPEQAMSARKAGKAADVFSVGATLYALLGGTSPFAGDSSTAVIIATIQQPHVPIREKRPDVSEGTAKLIDLCLEKQPERRFHDASALLDALRLCRDALSGNQTLAETTRVLSELQLTEERGENQEVVSALETLRRDDSRDRVLRRESTAGAARGGRETVKSVAVLPIAHESGSDLEYLADAVTEVIINRISVGTSSLRVIARTTAFLASSREPDPQKIGQILFVDAVIVGRLRRFGDVVRLNAEMLRVSDASLLFGISVSGRSQDVVELEQEMSDRVIQELQRRVEHVWSAPQPKPRTKNPAAYEAFIKGRFHWWRRTEKDILQSIGFFERAVAEDPAFALAYAGLANCYNVIHYYGNVPRREAGRKAREFAVKARSLDPSLADAYTALGAVHLYHEWDFGHAEECFTIAIRLDPTHVPALHWFGDMLSILGRVEEAIRVLDAGLEVDPLSMNLLCTRADALRGGRRLEDAAAAYESALEIDDTDASTNYWYGLTLEAGGELDRAEELFGRVNVLAPHLEYASALAHVRALKGNRGFANALLTGSNEVSRLGSPFHRAVLWSALGEPDYVIAELENGLDERAGRMLYLMCDPRFDAFHADDRFQRIVRTVGIR